MKQPTFQNLMTFVLTVLSVLSASVQADAGWTLMGKPGDPVWRLVASGKPDAVLIRTCGKDAGNLPSLTMTVRSKLSLGLAGSNWDILAWAPGDERKANEVRYWVDSFERLEGGDRVYAIVMNIPAADLVDKVVKKRLGTVTFEFKDLIDGQRLNVSFTLLPETPEQYDWNGKCK